MYRHGFKSAAGLTLPDFLGIGAQKSATTWLHHNLKAHPQIFVPQNEDKELHFFDEAINHHDLDYYAKFFEPVQGKIKGEITPAYGILPISEIRFIRTVMPNLRLIFLMRNPIDRAWSHALMELTWKANRPIEQVSDEEFLAHFQSPASRRRGDYETILNNWRRIFPTERFFLVFYEDVISRPRELLTNLFQHLGVSTDVDWTKFPLEKRFYEGSGIQMPEQFRPVLMEMYRPAIVRMRERWNQCKW